MRSIMQKLRFRMREEKGFTLAEIIISIAALSLISGFILQMLLMASHINQKAKEIDQAGFEAIATLEDMTAALTPDQLALSTLYYDDAWKPLPDAQNAKYTLSRSYDVVKEHSSPLVTTQGPMTQHCQLLRLHLTVSRIESDGAQTLLAQLNTQKYYVFESAEVTP